MNDKPQKYTKNQPEEYRVLDSDDFNKIAQSLEVFHGVFTKLWQLGRPRLTDKLPTAAVSFNRDGDCVDFGFNPTFYNELTEYDRLFVVSHECLHVILDHGRRSKHLLQKSLCNIAMDVAVNEMLVRAFGFDRNKLSDRFKKDGCWVDTVFKNEKDSIATNKSFEYYYNLLIKDIFENFEQMLKDGRLKIVDGHGGIEGASDAISDKIDELLGDLNNEEKKGLSELAEKDFKDAEENSDEKISDSKLAGSVGGSAVITIRKMAIRRKHKWETVVKKWAAMALRENDKPIEQWARLNRRFVTVDMGKMFLPSEMEVDDLEMEESKLKVVFMLDSSGSCAHLAERFFKASETLDPKRFDVDLYCFDTSVYEVNMKDRRLYGFGGTSFHIIEDYIQDLVKKGKKYKKYPDAVWLLSDGAGDLVKPQFPDRWHWFLTAGGSTSCYPKASHTHKLADFE